MKIALRTTRGPTNSCISFHCDGGNATTSSGSISQIAPIDPSGYKGGRLFCFVNDRIYLLKQSAGSIVHYPPKVLLGVTALTEGTGKS
jgi:predicted 2-oxoglutarate/Fe(II)-dependent dioxygenase YbiX